MHEQKTEFTINDIVKSKGKEDVQILQYYNITIMCPSLLPQSTLHLLQSNIQKPLL